MQFVMGCWLFPLSHDVRCGWNPFVFISNITHLERTSMVDSDYCYSAYLHRAPSVAKILAAGGKLVTARCALQGLAAVPQKRQEFIYYATALSATALTAPLFSGVSEIDRIFKIIERALLRLALAWEEKDDSDTFEPESAEEINWKESVVSVVGSGDGRNWIAR